jgi:hypothetical protein
MVFDLNEPDENSEDWIFGVPKWTNKKKRRALMRKRSLKKMNDQIRKGVDDIKREER